MNEDKWWVLVEIDVTVGDPLSHVIGQPVPKRREVQVVGPFDDYDDARMSFGQRAKGSGRAIAFQGRLI